MKYLAILAMLSFMTALSEGQTKRRTAIPPACTIAAASLPAIRGLRLGMTVSDLLAAFPEPSSKKAIEKAVSDAQKPDAYGFGRATLQSVPEVNPKFSGVLFVSIELMDGRLSSFRIDYLRGPEWKNADQFVSKLSDAFHLPPADRWRSADLAQPYELNSPEFDNGVRILTCDGFTILATINNGNGGSAIVVRNLAAKRIADDREEAAKEKIRQAFKP